MSETSQTEDVKTRFKEDGFAVMKGFFSEQEVLRMSDEVERFIRDVLPGLPGDIGYYEDKEKPETLFRLNHMDVHDNYFARLRDDERLVSLATDLLDDRPIPQAMQMFGKPPIVGSPTPPHQDGFYFRLTPNEALTFWIPLDPVSEENGTIRFIPGSHRRGMRPHDTSSVFGFSLGVTDYGPKDETLEVSIEAEPGDLAVHHSMTIHLADANTSNLRRNAIGQVFYASRARKDKEGTTGHRADMHEQWRKAGKL
jgi:phytanoyl-CoA hydroxylase